MKWQIKKKPDFDNTVGAKFETTTKKSQPIAPNDQNQTTKSSHPKPPTLNEKQQRAHRFNNKCKCRK